MVGEVRYTLNKMVNKRENLIVFYPNKGKVQL